MKKEAIKVLFVFVLALFTFYACNDQPNSPTEVGLNKTGISSTGIANNNAPKTSATVSLFASGFNNPRGLKFGPDGNLYVAEAGTGGDISTAGQCDSVIPPVGPYLGGYTARISKVSPDGSVSTFADNLPSAVNALHDFMGVADIAFYNNSLYALLAAGGCSHGHSDVPASVIKFNDDGSWNVFADLSTYQHNNPVAAPEADDFEPDGSWYSLVSAAGNLYAVEPNHGELVKINSTGTVSRVLDFSAKYGHIVPTAMAYRGNFFVGNLHTFPITPGSSNIYKVTPGGQVMLWAKGLTTVLGVTFDNKGIMYVLETSDAPGFPTPNMGKIIRVLPSGQQDVLVDTGLTFPTGITYGPDGALYVSNKGFGPFPGEVLKVTLDK